MGWSWRTGRPRRREVRRLGEREVEIVLREGRNRQVRRMAEAVGNGVVALRRVRFGPIELGALPPGEARRLGDEEVASLWQDVASMKVGAYEGPRERLFAVRGAAQAEANEADAILSVDRGADAGADRAQRPRRRRRWSAACSRRPTTSTPSSPPSPPATSASTRCRLLCAREIAVPGAMPRVIRVMVHFYAPAGHTPAHVYLGEAKKLRADLEAAQ